LIQPLGRWLQPSPQLWCNWITYYDPTVMNCSSVNPQVSSASMPSNISATGLNLMVTQWNSLYHATHHPISTLPTTYISGLHSEYAFLGGYSTGACHITQWPVYFTPLLTDRSGVHWCEWWLGSRQTRGLWLVPESDQWPQIGNRHVTGPGQSSQLLPHWRARDVGKSPFPYQVVQILWLISAMLDTVLWQPWVSSEDSFQTPLHPVVS
jgi:hypothetical protein